MNDGFTFAIDESLYDFTYSQQAMKSVYLSSRITTESRTKLKTSTVTDDAHDNSILFFQAIFFI